MLDVLDLIAELLSQSPTRVSVSGWRVHGVPYNQSEMIVVA
jgi:hypothetical protein